MKFLRLLPALLAMTLVACTSVQSPNGSVSETEVSEPAMEASSSDGAVSSVPPVPLTGSDVEYGRIGDRGIRGYLSVPEGPGAHPAVVLIHEWWGLNDTMRRMADKFAAQGYVALAVDLYEDKVATDQTQAQQYMEAVRGDMDRGFENLNDAVAYLKARKDVDQAHVASVGWCFGGGWSYEMAKNDLGVKASVMYYGHFDPHDDFAHMKADIQGHFGAEDQSIKVDTVHEFEAALKTHNGIHEVYIYPNAGHAFANEDNPASYNKEAADLAWQRTMDFLGRALK